jgi:hypothetical protein
VTRLVIQYAANGADALRRAAGLEDPYLRADAVWEAVLYVRKAEDRLDGQAAAQCADVGRYLEEACEVSGRPVSSDVLTAYVEALDAIRDRRAGRMPGRAPIELHGSINP